MNEQAQRYPLSWPVGWKRTHPHYRRRAPFRSHGGGFTNRLSVAQASDRLERELNLLKATDPLLSTNVRLGLRGAPLSSQGEPSDTGAAVYCKIDGKPICFASDKWDRVADNIAAIAQHIDALRRIDRYGVGRMERAFAGYAALPPSTEEWYVVLGLTPYATLDQVEEAFKKLAKDAHPDAGGSHEAMSRLTAARDLARTVLSQ